MGAWSALRPGDGYPPRALEVASTCRLRPGERVWDLYDDSGAAEVRRRSVAAETRAEILSLDLTEFVRVVFPSELPYSLEHCTRFLSTHPTARSSQDVRSFCGELLRHVPFFLGVPATTTERLASRMELLRLDAGERLRLSAEDHYCFVLLSGCMTREGKIDVKPGDLVGRDRVLRPHVRAESAFVAIEACDLAVLEEPFYRGCMRTSSLASGRSTPWWPTPSVLPESFGGTGSGSASCAPPRPPPIDASDGEITGAVLGLVNVPGVAPASSLDKVPRCMRLWLAKHATVERHGAYACLEPLDKYLGVVVRGTVSIHGGFRACPAPT